jgi:hypothetical protein
MVQEFHPNKYGEPCWRGIFEEFVVVGCYVEFAELVGEVCVEEGWLEGDCVDYWVWVSMQGM